VENEGFNSIKIELDHSFDWILSKSNFVNGKDAYTLSKDRRIMADFFQKGLLVSKWRTYLPDSHDRSSYRLYRWIFCSTKTCSVSLLRSMHTIVNTDEYVDSDSYLLFKSGYYRFPIELAYGTDWLQFLLLRTLNDPGSLGSFAIGYERFIKFPENFLSDLKDSIVTPTIRFIRI
jgi:hypothetical protein